MGSDNFLRLMSWSSRTLGAKTTNILLNIFFTIIDLVGKLFAAFGVTLCPLTIDNLLKDQRHDVVSSLQDPAISRPVSLLMQGLEKLHMPLRCRIELIEELRRNLLARMDVLQAVKENPLILKTPVQKPVILIGLPRTGTTLLHNLLSLDERFLTPMTWELTRPVPPGRPDDWRNCERFTKTRDELDYFVTSCNIMMYHPIYADKPEECYFILQNAFYSVHHFLYLRNQKEREEWFYNLSTEEATEVYEYFKKALQCIAYGNKKQTQYLLKCYVHGRDPEALLKVFPDACLVYTHRPMSNVVSSYCAMTRSEFVHRWGECDNQYGQRVLRLMGKLSSNAVDLIQKYENLPQNEQPIIDIAYTDLVADPLKQIERIYSHFGMKLTDDVRLKMKAYMENNPRYKHGKYSYALSDFHLTEDDIRDKCSKYINYFESKGYKAV